MADAEYHFLTHWRVRGGALESFRIIDDVAALPRWWPSVYLEVEQLEPGDADGVGKVVRLLTKGWLPYTLSWQLVVLEKETPTRILLEASGDFLGRGEWKFTTADAFVDITYDWRVEAETPLLRRLSWLLRPVFSANHHWAMARGEESLQLELDRCAAVSDDERARIPAPPAPTFMR